MKKIKYLLIAMAGLAIASCSEKYPDLEDGLYAEFETNKGVTVAKLYHEQTPLTVANFVALAEGDHESVTDSSKIGKKYYDGLIFHRVIKDFMIQGGDPEGTGRGGPGYKFADEIVDSLQHSKKGILSMANSGPATNGSQFFITLKETPWLNGRHTVFGEIVEGIDVIDSIGAAETLPGDKPKDSIVLTSVNIIRKGSSAKSFKGNEIFQNETIRIEKEKAEKEKLAIEKAAGTKARLDGFKTKATKLDSGLEFALVNKGNGQEVKSEELVGVYYAGYFEDGRLFDTNIESIAKQTETFNPQRAQQNGYSPMPVPYSNKANMIPGFKEGLLKMKNIGDKAVFFIPSHLGYGDRATGPIPANSSLIFEVEFKEIVKK